MNVHLTFDVEVWCNGWANLDRNFPDAFERYVYGRSASGDYALPKTLEILERNGLRGLFFVEPLFSARFGSQYLELIVALIRRGGHDVQLHLHPEWTDEIDPPILPIARGKRQHLIYYDLEEQTALIAAARKLLESAGSGTISAPSVDGLGSLLEITGGGARPIELPDGEQRTFLEDGDEVILTARAHRPGAAPIGFGECRAIVLPTAAT